MRVSETDGGVERRQVHFDVALQQSAPVATRHAASCASDGMETASVTIAQSATTSARVIADIASIAPLDSIRAPSSVN